MRPVNSARGWKCSMSIACTIIPPPIIIDIIPTTRTLRLTRPQDMVDLAITTYNLVSSGGQQPTLVQQNSSGNYPSYIIFEFHPQLQMVKSGQVADLSDLIDPVKDDFNPNDIKSHTVDGKIYGIRMIDDPQFFYYRKSMLEKAKVCVSPGIGFGDHGDDHVRFALIENESRIRQAIRGIKTMFKADGVTPA